MTIYFYKVWQPYGCFSNFSRHGIQIQDTYWPTVEHYYQAQKFVGSVDAVIIPVIHAAETPEEAAALGRCCTRQLRPDWEIVKTQIMQEAVFKKFLTHLEIKEILLSTGNETLVENSPNDYFWGCGAENTGQNHLGKILMGIRAEILQSRLFTVISSESKLD
ncbi:MAG TPA: NADAR domain-containing protein [Nodularia sp. (in: cyanobacteria)]|nr:NADAR domain-containing protein [Nodularia sp. (in: cyanobacteria)]